ncbi:MAG TPA: hypothetical protein PKI89_13540 [Tepidiformaceae bacterium]|nr:hypothetical protein [Tepidiformaceae bacterium]HNO66751.1 hypothetical protein [Tepidiformaceae bacterium]
MNATTEDRDEPMQPDLPARNAEDLAMQRCKRCQLLYSANKSTSALKLTYCSFLCELGDLGFSMQGLEHMERAPKAEAAPEAPEAPAGELAPSAAII